MRVTRVTNHLPTHPGVRGAHLRIVGGNDAGTEIELPPVGVLVGADAGNDLSLDDSAVSSRHCTISPTEGGFLVRDMGSRNGTFVDGVAITEATVAPGTILRVGKSLLQLMPGDASIEIPPSDRHEFGDLAGSSMAMRRAFAVLERASQSDAPVLLHGESGTGKELTARAIHDASPRKHNSLVTFDCGAASATLIESALFGHVKGAFTGAVKDKEGAFAMADRGTLFLDEIGDLPLELQPKLLRLLEAGEVTRLGAESSEHFDVRVVAASHKNLFDEVGRGLFRADLYYRLAVIEVHVPPLRARLEDIPRLAAHFLAQAGAGDAAPEGANLEKLMGYHWPGNVRELRNVISRGVALAADKSDFQSMPILLRSPAPDGATSHVRADRPYKEAKADVVDQFDHAYLTDLLRRADGNMSEAARLAGLERKHLYRMLDRLGMR